MSPAHNPQDTASATAADYSAVYRALHKVGAADVEGFHVPLAEGGWMPARDFTHAILFELGRCGAATGDCWTCTSRT